MVISLTRRGSEEHRDPLRRTVPGFVYVYRCGERNVRALDMHFVHGAGTPYR